MEQSTAAYLEYLAARNYSLARMTHARRILERLSLYLEEEHLIRDWRAVAERHLNAFAVYLAARHRSPQGRLPSFNSLRQWLSITRRFFAWMQESGRLLGNPAEQLALPRKDERLPAVLSETEMAHLLDQPDTGTAIGLRDRALMELLYSTGIRHFEAVRLDLYDADTSMRQLIIRQGKGRKDRMVPLTENACHWLDRYLAEARPELAAGRINYKRRKSPATRPHPTALWLSITGTRFGYVAMSDRIRQYALEAGVTASLHTFRHTCATHLLRRGASIRHIQQLLGHKCLETTEIYTRLEIEDLRQAVDKASQRMQE
jgi:integrase/recombinase XerD